MPPLSVTQVVNHIGLVLEVDELLSDIYVQGEVSRVSKAASGHCYFALKDDESVLEAVMFRGGVGADHLIQGEEVLVFGRVTVYARQGRLQIIANLIQPSGIGELQVRFEQMKSMLESEGLFDASRKRPLPAYPEVIGVATSEDSAVWHDIIRTIRSRFPTVEIVLAHTLVQGSLAASMIADSVRSLSECPGVEVVLVARGGGSPEDLWPFNEESVARAIFSSKIPVVTGVGHETDWTIADLVADVRASTPTGAAMQLVPDVLDIEGKLSHSAFALTTRILGFLSNTNSSINSSVSTMNFHIPDTDNFKMSVDELVGRSDFLISHMKDIAGEEFRSLKDNLKLVSPKNTLERGYSIVQKKAGGEIVTSTSDLSLGDNVEITVKNGKFGAVTEWLGPNRDPLS